MIQTVLVQIRPQSTNDPGQITEGFYEIQDGYLQMTYRDGKPLDNPNYRVLLGDKNAREVAAHLTKLVRTELSGEVVEGFNRDLVYPRTFVA
jgi:hypothetical protein